MYPQPIKHRNTKLCLSTDSLLENVGDVSSQIRSNEIVVRWKKCRIIRSTVDRRYFNYQLSSLHCLVVALVSARHRGLDFVERGHEVAEVNPGFRSRSCHDLGFWDSGEFLECDHGSLDDEGGQVSARKPVASLKSRETLRKRTPGNRRNTTTRAIHQQLDKWSVVNPTWLPSPNCEASLHGHERLKDELQESP